MEPKQARHLWLKIRKVKPWYLLALGLLSAVICIIGLRSNYSHMVSLRNAVYSADQKNSGIELALQNLQSFVTHNMNTNLTTTNGVYPPIQLKYTYNRLVQAQSQQLAQESTQNATLYTQAQAYCEAKYPSGYVINKVPCIDNYISAHGVNVSLNFQSIPASLYEFDFVSPSWSPDLAGWGLVAAVLFIGLFICLWIAEHFIRKRAK
jgi:hypothetical protein